MEVYHDIGLGDLLAAGSEVEPSAPDVRESETLNDCTPLSQAQTMEDMHPLSQAQSMEDMLRAMSETFTTQLSAINSQILVLNERVNNVENVEKGPKPTESTAASRPVLSTTLQAPTPSVSKEAANTPPLLWCDRPIDEPIPTDVVTWPNEDPTDGEDGCQLHKISDETEAFLESAFTKPVSNSTRRRWRKIHGMPACDSTKCPKLDSTIKAQLPKECKEADRPLARLQALVLDAVGPLSALLELHQKGQLTPDKAGEAASQALRFLGNASTNISAERRRKIANYLNKDLHPLIEDGDFSNAAPQLFGKDFEKSAKEHIDSVKSLRKISQTANQGAGQRFFRQSHSYAQAARGGGSFRVGSHRGRGRYRPYQAPNKENRPRDRNSHQP